MATIRLFKNIPWSQGGFHVLRFQSNLAQAAFFNGLTSLEFTDIDYEPRPGANLNLPISYAEAREYTYMIYEHDNASDSYYFIEDYEYLNDNPTTRFIISPDYWQTHHLGMSIAPGIVHRRHMPRWNGTQPILYPVDEGTPRSFKSAGVTNLNDGRNPDMNMNAVIICTSKKLEDSEHPDGIYYYLTWNDLDNHGRIGTPLANKYWMDLTGPDLNLYFEKWGVGLAPVVSINVIPNCTLGQNTSGDSPTFQSLYGNIVEPSDTSSGGVLFAVNNPINGVNPVYINTGIRKPTKNTSAGVAASLDYEPQAWSDNVLQYSITDNSGSSAITIPNDWAYRYSQIGITNSVFSLNPIVSFYLYYNDGGSVTGTMADGMAINVPCIPVDIPQSAWADYQFQGRNADRQIMENNISSRYLTSAVSGLTGAASGGAYGAMYAESFNNSKRSPMNAGLAGVAMGGISGIGSLVNSYIQAGTDRDNFKLNEQKIKNTPAPPIAGSNYANMRRYGNNLVKLEADEVSRNIIWNQYRYYGVIVDQSMPIPLRTRYYYDYIQTRDCTVRGEMTNVAKTYLEALFNRGVTIWHADSATIYDYQYDNVEWSG